MCKNHLRLRTKCFEKLGCRTCSHPACGWKTEENLVAPDKWVLGPEGCCCCLNHLAGFTFSQSKLLSLSPQCQVGSTGPAGLQAACQRHWRRAQFSDSALLFLHVSYGHLRRVLGRVERIVTNRMCSFPQKDSIL